MLEVLFIKISKNEKRDILRRLDNINLTLEEIKNSFQSTSEILDLRKNEFMYFKKRKKVSDRKITKTINDVFDFLET